MKLTIVIIFALLIAKFELLSSDNNNNTKEKTVRNEANALSILTSFGDQNKAQFAGFMNGIGAQFYFADYLAVRGSFGIDNSKKTNFAPKNSNLPNEEIMKQTFNFDLGIKFTFSETRNVVGYAGTNLYFIYKTDQIVNEGFIENNPEVRLLQRDIAWGWFLGGEYFPTDNVSIAFEYSLYIQRLENERNIGKDIAQQISRYSRFGIDARNISLIFALWIN